MNRATIPTLEDIDGARAVLADLLPVTRLVPSRPDGGEPSPFFLKLESELPTRSFKIRGALYAVSRLRAPGGVGEIVASSTGNHGAAVAYAGREFGLPVRIFLPENPNPLKLRTIERLGATVVQVGHDLPAAISAAEEYAAREGAYLLADATDPWIPAGAGTLALEVLDQRPDAGCLVVPVGDTALIRGVAAGARAVKPDIVVIGVQAERAPSYARSWEAGEPRPTDECDTIADGLATRTPLPENVKAIREVVDDFVTVSEQELLDAVRALLLDHGVVAEPSGAAALAGYLRRVPGEGRGPGPAVLVVSGGNLTADVARAALG